MLVFLCCDVLSSVGWRALCLCLDYGFCFCSFVYCLAGLVVDYSAGLAQSVRYLAGRFVSLGCGYWICLCCFCGIVFDLIWTLVLMVHDVALTTGLWVNVRGFVKFVCGWFCLWVYVWCFWTVG